MSRVAHKFPMFAYDHVANLLVEAGGSDKRISKDNAGVLVAQLREQGRGTEALAAHNIFKMIDMRDNEKGHQVTEYDLRADRKFVKEKLLENRDINGNGYAANEIEDMSPTGRALMELGQALQIKNVRGRVPHATPERGLFHIAARIREAAKADLITSRADADAYADKLYEEGHGAESSAFRYFYGFLDHRDAAPGARITDEDITKAVDYALEHMLENKDLNNNGYSKAEIDAFSPSSRSFLTIGKMIENGIIKSAMPIEGSEVRKTLSKAVSGEEFDQMGSEGGQPLKAVHRDGHYRGVTEASFRKAFGLSKRPLQVHRDFKADELRQFIANNSTTYKDGEAITDQAKADRAFATTAILRSLTDLKVFVTGSGDQGSLATYIVGLARDKSMVGLQTNVIWT